MGKTLSVEDRYIANEIKLAQERYWRELDDLCAKSIICPIFLLVLSGILWLLDYILSDLPVINWIYLGFHIDYLCFGLMMIMLVVSVVWICIGVPVYFAKKKNLKKQLNKEIKKIETEPVDDMTLFLYETILEPAQKKALHNAAKNLETLKRKEFHQSGSETSAGNKKKNTTYEDDLREYKRKHFCFVDASGAYRHWGDDFIDTKGNWCRWGTSFYDSAGNYIDWGNTFQDSNGVYRHWGDDFIDGGGNWVEFVQ